MTTYTKTGFSIQFGAKGAVQSLNAARELALFLPRSGNSRFTYETEEIAERDLPLAQIRGDGRILLALDGGGLPTAHGLFFSTLHWSAAGQTYSATVMGLDLGDGTGQLAERVLFPVAGDGLPPMETLADWQGFAAQITAWETVETGRFAPGQVISWGLIFDAASTDDLAIGTGGINAIETGDGDDLILPGNNDGYDFIATGAGEDEIRFTGVTHGFYDLYFRDLKVGIRADIHARKNHGEIEKGAGGAAGHTRLVDVADAFSAGGIYLYGTDYDDHLKVVPGFGAFVGLRGDGGDDVITIGKGAGHVRLSFASAEEGVRVNLSRGWVAQDGLGGQDRIRGRGEVDEVLAGSGNDHIVGSAHDERFFLQGGRDQLDGRGGYDILRFDRDGGGAVRADLAKGQARGTWEGETFQHRFKNIEALYGSLAGDDRLLGDTGQNTLLGLGGDDLLKGRKGRDHLDGGTGDDRLVGGGGADVFVFSIGADVVGDFHAGQDRLDLSSSRWAGMDLATLLAGDAGDIRQVGDDVLLADGRGNQMRLEGLDLALLGDDSFIF